MEGGRVDVRDSVENVFVVCEAVYFCGSSGFGVDVFAVVVSNGCISSFVGEFVFEAR